ncbi:class I SAM-dependent methyltransferase [Aquimarina sp. ERC-38]|uniref:class I SAM-dependent methyltransferase n=1 Tax=Aquimarina sp. ERC-38 TaxID=2949996 RepID=UPI002246D691|nr:class I SAM-dependent methyltransferase [Aquimarina sp. ERC-38]UZO79811.1 class I SAM-dependent methyltransferase [Aquimarina sp. ERC-38]
MNNKQLISKNIELFYNKASEETRLNNGMGIFEFERVKELIEKYIPFPNSKIIDIGGGTGKYSEWLARKGHQVCLVDPVYKHVKLAQKRSNKLKNKFSIELGESRNLKFQSNFADLIILHGPLYHLQNRKDRDQSIREAKRILKNGGIILGFAINRTASTLVGLLNGLFHEETYFQMCKEELTTGIHNPPDGFPWLLAEAYYHNPGQLKEEFGAQNLTYLNTYAIEGMAWLDKAYFTNMQNDTKRSKLMELIKITENDSHLLSFSPHMMIAVKKQIAYGK